ncbi:MAG: Rieske 2Fe-2S domain-containing protein [Proteobacteria bacterium]|nr:Rieske 2Fe-2S domain-containing protein [Pseudomonadota bacterium]
MSIEHNPMPPRDADLDGRAYGRTRAVADEALVRCGPGTAGGELLRRYWQPVALLSELGSVPKLVKVLDEELVLYRDRSGTPGLLYPRCMHRGTSLLYGKIEQHGIRCCYHGWLFDERGRCLEMPCEPNSPVRNHIRQPWYPVIEKFGILFAYLGPADRQPLFPHFTLEDNLGPTEQIVSYARDAGPNGGGRQGVPPKLAAWSDYNWWQMFDNYMDAFHVLVLHNMINGTQFEESLAIVPTVKFESTANGVRSIQHRTLSDGRIHQRITQVMLPNINGIAGVSDADLGRGGVGWTVPIDDTHYRAYGISLYDPEAPRSGGAPDLGLMRDTWGPKHGRPFQEWSTEDHQHWQTDYTAQKAQGDISLHSEEHLTRIDTGVGLMRRLFRQQAQMVANGADPVGVTFDRPYVIQVQAGNALLDPQTLQCIAGFDGR